MELADECVPLSSEMADDCGPFAVTRELTVHGPFPWRVVRKVDVVPWDEILPESYATWEEARRSAVEMNLSVLVLET